MGSTVKVLQTVCISFMKLLNNRISSEFCQFLAKEKSGGDENNSQLSH